MPVERVIKSKVYVRAYVPDIDALKAMKDDAERIIAGNKEGTPLFNENTIKVFQQVLADLKRIDKSELKKRKVIE